MSDGQLKKRLYEVHPAAMNLTQVVMENGKEVSRTLLTVDSVIDEAKKSFPKYEETVEEKNCDDGESSQYHSAIYRYVIKIEQWFKEQFGDVE